MPVTSPHSFKFALQHILGDDGQNVFKHFFLTVNMVNLLRRGHLSYITSGRDLPLSTLLQVSNADMKIPCDLLSPP